MTPEQIKRNTEELRLLDSKKNEGNGVLGWVFFKNRLTELALPIIEALLRELSDAQAERDALQARVNDALTVLKSEATYYSWMIDGAIEILTGEGE